MQAGCIEQRARKLKETDTKEVGQIKSGGHDLVCFLHCLILRAKNTAFHLVGAQYLLNE